MVTCAQCSSISTNILHTGAMSTRKNTQTVGKLTVKSPARQLLRKKFLPGEITGDEDPKEVWESEGVFGEHKIGNFRTHYKKTRKEFSKSIATYMSTNFSRNCLSTKRKMRTCILFIHVIRRLTSNIGVSHTPRRTNN